MTRRCAGAAAAWVSVTPPPLCGPPLASRPFGASAFGPLSTPGAPSWPQWGPPRGARPRSALCLPSGARASRGPPGRREPEGLGLPRQPPALATWATAPRDSGGWRTPAPRRRPQRRPSFSRPPCLALGNPWALSEQSPAGRGGLAWTPRRAASRGAGDDRSRDRSIGTLVPPAGSSLWDPVSAPILGCGEGPQQGDATRWPGQAGSREHGGRGGRFEESSPLAGEGVHVFLSPDKNSRRDVLLRTNQKRKPLEEHGRGPWVGRGRAFSSSALRTLWL